MPTRLLRWIRSKDRAITARTPRSAGPLAAQSRDDPDPYSRPPITISGVPSAVARGGIEDDDHLAAGQVGGEPPSLPSGELVVDAEVREGAADHHVVVASARAVATEVAELDAVLEGSRRRLAGRCCPPRRCGRWWPKSPKSARTRASAMVRRSCGSAGMAEEIRLPNVGRRGVPVEGRPVGAPNCCQGASPPKMRRYSRVNNSVPTAEQDGLGDLVGDRQSSFRNTGSPSGPVPGTRW